MIKFLTKIIKILIIQSATILKVTFWYTKKLLFLSIAITIGEKKYKIPPKMIKIPQEMWFLGDYYEPYLCSYLKEQVNKGDFVIDIGAYLGYHSLLASCLVGKEGSVIAFEPVRRNFTIIRKILAINKINNIIVRPEAIGAKRRDATISIPGSFDRATLSNTDHPIFRKKMSQAVNIDSLDNLFKKNQLPDIIKIDVEGFESEVIKGMQKIMRQRKKLKIILEFHYFIISKKDKQRMVEILKTNGFRVLKAALEPCPKCQFLKNSHFINRILCHFSNWREYWKEVGSISLELDDMVNYNNKSNNILHILLEKG